jgi:hypothetical protein
MLPEYREPKTLLEALESLKELIQYRNEKFGLGKDTISERVDYAKAKTSMDRRERLILADALDEIADVIDRESRFFTTTRVNTKEGRITNPDGNRDTGVYLAFQKVERALSEAADSVRLDAQILRKLV